MAVTTSTDKNKSSVIAKNTMMLYFRTSITMLVSLYTGRIMLDALGIEDYGTNNVVGGIVSMSNLVTGTMSASISRYITYSLGEGNISRLKTVFSTSVNVQFLMAAVSALLLEAVGVWFLNYEANIPEGRMEAANWILQCSIFGLAVGLIRVPFSAVIIAHEHMKIYAYLGIVDVFTKLGICFIIQVYGGDRLILYAILILCSQLLNNLLTWGYCMRHFIEVRFRRMFDVKLLKEMSAYAGWNLFGSSAWILNTQGVNMLVNVFYGVTFNASRAVAGTINGAVQRFVGDFTTAFSPQITKSYASGDIEYLNTLAIRGTKFTWLLMHIFIVPVFLEAETLLGLWLVDVPPLASVFLRLTLFESLAIQSGQTLFKAIQATGNVKRYQIEVTMWGFCVFPLTWIAFKLDAPVWTPYVIFIVVYFLLNIVRLYTLRRLMVFPVRRFLRESLLPCLFVSLMSFTVPLLIGYFIPIGIIHFLIIVPIAVIWTTLCCYQWGFNVNERKFFINKLNSLILAKIYIKLK